MSYELIAILVTSVVQLGASLGGFIYLGRQSKHMAEHMAVANSYLADQVTTVGQRLADQVTTVGQRLGEHVKAAREDLEAQLRRNAYLQTLMHDWSAERFKEVLALLQKGEL